MKNDKSRISILSKVVTETGEYDDTRCKELLGEYYDSFISLCDHIQIMPEDIEKVGLIELRPKEKKAMYKIITTNGLQIEIET